MSDFEVLVEKVLGVEDHPNADRLSLVQIRGYKCISAKLDDGSHRYKVGDLVIYVPEDALVPEYMLRRGFWDDEKNQGILSGPQHNKVKAIKLRGELSQGILYSVNTFEGYDPEKHFVLSELYPTTTAETLVNGLYSEPVPWSEGMDVSKLLGITKYEPVLPSNFAGEAGYIGREHIPHFDVENIKKFPTLLEGKQVYIEEKIHGTCFIAGYIPGLNKDFIYNQDYFVTSKGLAGKGIVYEANATTVYNKMFKQWGLEDKLFYLSDEYFDGRPVFILGEVYGQGIQDLGYSSPISLRVFGIYVGNRAEGFWLDPESKYSFLNSMDLNAPPLLYTGPFDVSVIEKLTNGNKSALDDKTIREGIVITPAEGFNDRQGRRAILKSVSEEYLLRKGNTTEFQ